MMTSQQLLFKIKYGKSYDSGLGQITFNKLKNTCKKMWRKKKKLQKKFNSPEDLLDYVVVFMGIEHPESFIKSIEL